MTSPSIFIYFLFLICAFLRVTNDQSSDIRKSYLQNEIDRLWRNGIHCISANRSLRALKCMSTFPNIKRGTMHTYLYMSFILLTCATDIELNPGPRKPKHPCQICHRAVTWKDKAVSCDDCEMWYHAKCMNMSSIMYNCLKSPNLSWHCVACEMPQFTSSFFELQDLQSTNSFSSLDSADDSFGNPDACSSPKPTKQSKPKPWNTFEILNINFQSIRNKKPELLNVIEHYNPNIIIGTETWLTDNIHSSELFPSSYNVYRKDRKGGYGGVLIAVKSDIISEPLDMETDSESIYVSVDLHKGNRLIIGALYRPPSSSIEYMDDMCTSLEKITNRFRKAVFWVGGDLNLPDINWTVLSIEGNSNLRAINQRFLDCVQSCGMEQKVDFPTRQNASLDLFLTNRPSLVDKCTAAPGISDHDMVHITASASARKIKSVSRKIFLWNRANLGTMKSSCHKLTSNFLEKFTTSSSIETMWSFIKEGLLNLQDQHVPSKQTSARFTQPWANRDVKRISRQKKRSFWKARKTGKAKDVHRYKRLKELARSICHSAYNDYITNIVSPESSDNPKKFWGFVKSLRTDNAGVAPLKDSSGITQADSMKKADILNSPVLLSFQQG
ncbi:hypothetical protein FSP39_009144 [Pinctada imbricata]|uniref:PHD-type domain-containing protein n=1 Tax=Pinctada imbricata TaxID=66713 RepID=A0AA89BLZ0_PINIB|nr:hypothetical protein FSP39_009144 [Pinctada imbricata]